MPHPEQKAMGCYGYKNSHSHPIAIHFQAIPAPGSLSSRQVGSRVMLPIAADPCGTAQLHGSKGSAPCNRVSPNQGMDVSSTWNCDKKFIFCENDHPNKHPKGVGVEESQRRIFISFKSVTCLRFLVYESSTSRHNPAAKLGIHNRIISKSWHFTFAYPSNRAFF